MGITEKLLDRLWSERIICWFQLLKCEDLLLFFVILSLNEESLGFELFVELILRHDFELQETVMSIFNFL